MDITQALDTVVNNQDLAAAEMRDVMRQIMTGQATAAQVGAFLVALRMKGESIDEIAGAVEVMRELATGVEVSGDYLVDIVGTGGDESNLFNVSTASSFVVAASGGRWQSTAIARLAVAVVQPIFLKPLGLILV